MPLLPSRFSDGMFGVCNDGYNIVRSLSVDGNNYTSQLNVTVTHDTARKTIECVDDDNLIILFSFLL